MPTEPHCLPEGTKYKRKSRAGDRRYYLKNREKILARQKEKRDGCDREKILNRKREHYRKNKEKVLAQQRAAYPKRREMVKRYGDTYRLRNSAVLKEKKRAYRDKNKEKIATKKIKEYLAKREDILL